MLLSIDAVVALDDVAAALKICLSFGILFGRVWLRILVAPAHSRRRETSTCKKTTSFRDDSRVRENVRFCPTYVRNMPCAQSNA